MIKTFTKSYLLNKNKYRNLNCKELYTINNNTPFKRGYSFFNFTPIFSPKFCINNVQTLTYSTKTRKVTQKSANVEKFEDDQDFEIPAPRELNFDINNNENYQKMVRKANSNKTTTKNENSKESFIQLNHKDKVRKLCEEVLVIGKKTAKQIKLFNNEQQIKKNNEENNIEIFSIFESEEEISFLSDLLTFHYIPHYLPAVRSFDTSLEFIGDRVIDFVANEFLYNNYCNMPADKKILYDITSNKYLATNAFRLTLDRHVRMFNEKGDGIESIQSINEKDRYYLLGSAIEMILGYISYHKSFELACEAAREWIFPPFPSADAQKVLGMKWVYNIMKGNDIRQCLAELIGEMGLPSPVYKQLKLPPSANLKVLKATPLFRFGIFIRDKMIEEGIGKTKKFAKTAAARNALASHYTWPTPGESPINLALNRAEPIPEELEENILPNNYNQFNSNS